MIELDFDEKIKICSEEMEKDYKIDSKMAENLIVDMDLYDIVFEYYEDTINEIAEEREKVWEEEMKHFPYVDDIHGGI